MLRNQTVEGEVIAALINAGGTVIAATVGVVNCATGWAKMGSDRAWPPTKPLNYESRFFEFMVRRFDPALVAALLQNLEKYNKSV